MKRLLLVFEIGGGFLEFAIITQNLLASKNSLGSLIFNAIFAAVFLVGVVAGLALIEKPILGLRYIKKDLTQQHMYCILYIL